MRRLASRIGRIRAKQPGEPANELYRAKRLPEVAHPSFGSGKRLRDGDIGDPQLRPIELQDGLRESVVITQPDAAEIGGDEREEVHGVFDRGTVALVRRTPRALRWAFGAKVAFVLLGALAVLCWQALALNGVWALWGRSALPQLNVIVEESRSRAV